MEERRNIRKAFFLVILAGIILFIFSFWILPTMIRFAGKFKGGSVATKSDAIPPSPPKLNDFNRFTNQTFIVISGTSEPASVVKLVLNGKERETSSDDSGNFSFKFSLNKGENSFYLFSLDSSGNKSSQTNEETITFDNEAPEIGIETPDDGQNFFGTSQQKITIKGNSEAGVALTINERVVHVSDSGSFSYTTTLSEGENTFTVKAVDKARNTTEKTLKLTFSP